MGSSSTTRSGSGISARAIATRCCWPPESCLRRRVRKAGSRPTSEVVGLRAFGYDINYLLPAT